MSKVSDFEIENNMLVETFLENTFLSSFNIDKPNKPNFKSVEIQINSTCDLGCKYCYYTNFGHELYKTPTNQSIMENLDSLLIWFRDNKMNPDLELFTGEIFAQAIGRKVLTRIFEFYKDTHPKLRPDLVLVPTNFTFISDDEITAYAHSMIAEFKGIGIRLGLSSSLDGKYMDKYNRPTKKTLTGEEEDFRTDEYYQKNRLRLF